MYVYMEGDSESPNLLVTDQFIEWQGSPVLKNQV